MIKGIYQSSRSLNSRFKNMSLVANNIANLDTTGYKRKLPFSEILAKQSGGDAKINQVTDFGQGEIVKTSNQYDLAIKGKNFFVLNTEDGVEFTRNGRFDISDEGYLVNETGKRVMGKSGDINVRAAMLEDSQTVTISKSGEIKVGELVIDTIMIAKIEDESQLKNLGESRFGTQTSDFEQADDSEYEIHQGYLETSNVNPVQEMESMIEVSMDYESSQKVVNYLDRTLEQANQIGKI